MWAEARKQEKQVKGLMFDLRKQALRKAEIKQTQFHDPLLTLRAVSHGLEIQEDQKMFDYIESGGNMMPLLGDQSFLVDKYDVRAMLPSIPDFNLLNVKRSAEEEELENKLNFERYLPLMQFYVKGIGPKESILVVAEELLARDYKFAPTKKDTERFKNSATKDKSSAGKGQFSSVGFNYETGAAIQNDEKKMSHHDEDEEQGEDEDLPSKHVSFFTEATKEKEKETDRYAHRKFAIKHYSKMVRDENRVQRRLKRKLEDEEYAIKHKIPNKRHRRSERDGDTLRSFVMGAYYPSSSSSRSSSRSRSPSPLRNRPEETEKLYMAERRVLESSSSGADSSSDLSDEELSDEMRGAMGAATKRERKKGKSKDKVFEADQAPRSSTHHVMTSASLALRDSDPKSLSRTTTPKKPEGDKTKEEGPGESKKETPQERVKRLMQEKLNSKIKEDEAEREKIQEKKELEERWRRENYGTTAYRPSSPDYTLGGSGRRSPTRERRRSYSRSRSPPRYSRRSRSPPRRWRSRSPTRDRRYERSRSRSRSPSRRGRDERRRSRSRSRDEWGRARRSTSRERKTRRSRSLERKRPRSLSRSPDKSVKKEPERSASPRRGRKRSRSPSLSRSRSLSPGAKRTKPVVTPAKPQPSLNKKNYDKLMEQLAQLEAKKKARQTGKKV